MFELSELKAKKLAELQEIAKELGLKKTTGLKKIELTYRIIDHQSTLPEPGDTGKETTNQVSDKKDTERKPIKPARKRVNQKEGNTEEKSQEKPDQSNKKERKHEHKKEHHNHKNGKGNRNNNGNSNNGNGNAQESHNKDNRNRYRQPDFEFEGIIESEGVLEMMQEGYGFLRSSDYFLSKYCSWVYA